MECRSPSQVVWLDGSRDWAAQRFASTVRHHLVALSEAVSGLIPRRLLAAAVDADLSEPPVAVYRRLLRRAWAASCLLVSVARTNTHQSRRDDSST